MRSSKVRLLRDTPHGKSHAIQSVFAESRKEASEMLDSLLIILDIIELFRELAATSSSPVEVVVN